MFAAVFLHLKTAWLRFVLFKTRVDAVKFRSQVPGPFILVEIESQPV